MKYLAGLQHIQYVFVYPELGDIVLAGPGEGWKINDAGDLVGLTTGRPVMWLDDLLVALRTAEATRQTGISCSIDPTSDGIVRVTSLLAKMHRDGFGTNPADLEEGMQAIEQTLGPQMVSIKGIPADSHFARVIVAADYQMKRLAMNFDPSPVKGLPSFLQMITSGKRRPKNMIPRWWLEPNYESLLVSPDGLAFEIRGASVKAMTEEDFVAANGSRERSGKASPLAQEVGRQHDGPLRRIGGQERGVRPVAQLHRSGGGFGLDREGPAARKGALQHVGLFARRSADDREIQHAEADRHAGQRAAKRGELADQCVGRSADVLLAIGRKGRAEPRPGPRTSKGGSARRRSLVVELKQKSESRQALVVFKCQSSPTPVELRLANGSSGAGRRRATIGNICSCVNAQPSRVTNLVLAAATILAAMSAALAATPAWAQLGGFGVRQQVGGVWVDADGVLRNRQVDETGQVRAAREEMLQPVPADARTAGLRMVSLRRLEGAIADHLKTGQPLDDEMKYLAGLQHIQYVFVYPELGDIVLAGPGEGWKINQDGDLVGLTTGRPVMWLDDLLVALRTAEATRQTGISCSIDPTNEGVVRVNALLDKMLRDGFGNNPDELDDGMRAIEQTMGPQMISIKGIPADSHFARVMIAADYQMKRLAMNFDPSPVKGLPSFLQMLKSGSGGIEKHDARAGGSSRITSRCWCRPTNWRSKFAAPASKR